MKEEEQVKEDTRRGERWEWRRKRRRRKRRGLGRNKKVKKYK